MPQLRIGSAVRGLRARLLGIVLVAVIPLVGTLFIYAGVQNQTAQDRVRADVQRSLLTDVSSMRDLVAESRATMVTFGITYAIQQRRWDLAQGSADRLKTLHPEYAYIAVADPTGRVLVSSTDQTGSVNVADQDFFKRAVRTGVLGVSGYSVDPVIRQPTITVSYPVYDARGKLVVVEYIGFESRRFSARMAPAGNTESVELLIGSGGVVEARSPLTAGAEGKILPSAELVRAVLAKRQGSATTSSLGGVSRQYFFAPVFQGAEGEFYLVSGFSESQLLAAQRRSLGLTLAGFGVFALLALGVAWVVGTVSIYRPMRGLEDVAGRLAAGDLTARSEVSGRSDEIGALGREFDNMAATIQSHVRHLELTQSEISALNAELESRVRRRTAELEASNKELEAFNYSVSHDLRAPLRAIDGFSQALLEDYGDKFDEEGRDHLDRVKAAANRMGELIDSLLTLSRLSRCEMEVQQVDLSAIAAEVVEALREGQPGRAVEIAIQPDVTGQCDPVLIRSVLENLLGNAWKFTGRTHGAHIEFGTAQADGENAYYVRDNGAGFDMAYSNKLFSAFQRLHGQAEFPGVGVGLATVSRIIVRHGGRVWANGSLGEGATFYFTLP